MMNRRRALMWAQEESDILFEISNRSVSAGDNISTGIKAFATDANITILLDFTLTERPTSGNGSAFRLIYCENTVFMYGARNTTAARAYYYWMSSGDYIDAGVDFANGSRFRICVTHSANSNYVYVKTKKDSGSVSSKQRSATFTPSNNTLFFGWPNNTNGMPNGTVNSAKVYNRVLTADEINDFFA